MSEGLVVVFAGWGLCVAIALVFDVVRRLLSRRHMSAHVIWQVPSDQARARWLEEERRG